MLNFVAIERTLLLRPHPAPTEPPQILRNPKLLNTLRHLTPDQAQN